jgi:hypothetical protein
MNIGAIDHAELQTRASNAQWPIRAVQPGKAPLVSLGLGVIFPILGTGVAKSQPGSNSLEFAPEAGTSSSR